MAVRDRVESLLREILGDDVNFNDMDLAMRSIKMLEVIVALEQEFDIHISEDAPLTEITNSLDNIVQYVESAQAAKK